MKLLEINKDGFIVNVGSREKIQSEFVPLVQLIENLCATNFGFYLVSLYIRGSVAVGEAYLQTSDLDVIGVLDHPATEHDRRVAAQIIEETKEFNSIVSLIDFTLISVGQLLYTPESKNLRVNMKTQSALLFGKDIVQYLPGVKPCRELALMLFSDVITELENLREIFKNVKIDREYQGQKRSVQFWCIWTCRLILRSSMGILMSERPVFSPDLVTCKVLFTQKYPNFTLEMEQVLDWAFQPPEDYGTMVAFLDTFIPKYNKLWNSLIDKE